MKGIAVRVLFLSVCLCFAAPMLFAQDPTPDPPAGGRPGAPTGDPQPYDKVITKDARTRKGLFWVHQVKDKFYYEIPKAQLNKEFLWVSQIARTTLGVGYGGQALANRVVRWERNENRIFMRSIDYSVIADSTTPIAQAVEASNNNTILMAFPIAAFGKDDAPVIDVTRLFSTDIMEFLSLIHI